VEKFEGGPVGLDTLATCISEEPETLEDVYEPYLMQLGLLKRTARGRMVTNEAYTYLNLKIKEDPQQKIW
jgi:Holliday junction DNA helicase RuvB